MVAVEVAALEVAVPVLLTLEVAVEPGHVKAEVDAVRADGVLYQLASGSPRHWPMVTPL